MKNAGDYNRRISIVRRTKNTNANGFDTVSETVVCKAWAKANATRGFTIVQSGSNFEDATVGLEIRRPTATITRKDIVLYAGKEWSIVYLNDTDTTTDIIELQVREVSQ